MKNNSENIGGERSAGRTKRSNLPQEPESTVEDQLLADDCGVVGRQSSDVAMIGQMFEQGLTVDDMAVRCGLSLDTIVRLTDQVSKSAKDRLRRSGPAMTIYEAIDSLEKIYRREVFLAAQESEKAVDIKVLQGIERCLELKMKLFGVDGKHALTATTGKESRAHRSADEVVIDVSRLSPQTLSELIEVCRREG